jgi:drug/metabolite transporter (DMT)-like permease
VTDPIALGLVFGLGSAVLWGFSNIFAALLGRSLDGLRTLAAFQATGLPLTVVVAVALGMQLPLDPARLLPAVIAGLIATVAYLALFNGLRLGPMSVVGPLIAANGGLGAVLAVVFLGEPLKPGQALGALLATAGVLLTGVSFDRDWRRTRLVGPGVALGVVAMVAFAVQTVVLAVPSRDLGWLGAFFVSRVTTAVTVLAAVGWAAARLMRRTDRRRPDRLLSVERTDWRAIARDRRAVAWIALGGVAGTFGFVAYAAGLEFSYAWLIGICSAFAPVMVLIAAIALFGERLRPFQWLGCLMVVASIPVIATA